MRLNKIVAPFRRLRWKLTFSYMAVTVAVVVALEVLAFAALLIALAYSSLPQSLAEQTVASAATQLRPLLSQTPVDTARLADWIGMAFAPQVRGSAVLRVNLWTPNGATPVEVTTDNSDVAVILDAQGQVLVANFPELSQTHGQPFVDVHNPELSGQLIAAARGGSMAIRTLADHTILVASPVTGGEGGVLGVLYVRLVSLAPAVPGTTLRRGLQVLGTSAVLFTIGAGIIGAFFGFLTAHGLTRRLYALSDAASAWGEGDFSVVIRDPAPDEIGQLAVQLNRMAGQVQGLLQTRAQLATLEERNRLARDLHDSVKQQVFAATMTLGAAQALWEEDPGLAKQKVVEAFDLARKAQRDLTALIQELRPAGLEGRGLVAALQEHVATWSERTGIEVAFDARSISALPPEVEQALYRVGQEALANVAKHSGATRVVVSLAAESEHIALTIRDDGAGFDTRRPSGGGLGLRSMRERTVALGGELDVDSGEAGTCIRASVPV